MRSDMLRTLALRLFFDFFETLGRHNTGTTLIIYLTRKAKFDKGAEVSIIRQSTYFEIALQCDFREKTYAIYLQQNLIISWNFALLPCENLHLEF